MSRKNQGKSPDSPGRQIFRFIVSFIAAYALLVAVFYTLGHRFIKLTLPFYALELKLLRPDYEVQASGIERGKDDRIHSYYRIKLNSTVFDSLGQPRRGVVVKVEFEGTNLYVYPIIVFSLIFAWPRLSARDRIIASGVAFPMIILFSLFDIPLQVITQFEQSFSVEYQWRELRLAALHFLANGGRLLFALLAFAGTIGIAVYFRPQENPANQSAVGRNDPCPCGSNKKFKYCCLGK